MPTGTGNTQVGIDPGAPHMRGIPVAATPQRPGPGLFLLPAVAAPAAGCHGGPMPSTAPRPSAALLPLAALGLGLVAPRPAAACSFAAPAAHEVDPAADDTVAPGAPTESAVDQLVRGRGPDCDAAGICSSTSCDDIGTLVLSWASGGDDQTPDAALGVRVTVVEGTAPAGLWPLDDAVVPDTPGGLVLHWIDGASDDQEALSFVLELTALDAAGNESAPARVTVEAPATVGAAPGDPALPWGCAVGGGALPTGLAALAVGLLGLVRRRR